MREGGREGAREIVCEGLRVPTIYFPPRLQTHLSTFIHRFFLPSLFHFFHPSTQALLHLSLTRTHSPSPSISPNSVILPPHICTHISLSTIINKSLSLYLSLCVSLHLFHTYTYLCIYMYIYLCFFFRSQTRWLQAILKKSKNPLTSV